MGEWVSGCDRGVLKTKIVVEGLSIAMGVAVGKNMKNPKTRRKKQSMRRNRVSG